MKFGNCSQIRLDPPTLANLGILNCYFFIADLASMSHDQDFKHNLFFSHSKVHQYLEKFPKYIGIKEEINFLSVRTTPPPLKKIIFLYVYYVFQSILSVF